MGSAFASVLRGFYGGVVDPVLIPTHLLALLAIGLMIARREQRASAIAAFVFGLAAGFAALIMAVEVTDAHVVVLAVAALAALAVAASVRLPAVAASAIAAIAGGALALDSPPQATSLAAAYAALMGTGLCATAIVGSIAMLKRRLSLEWQKIAMRILASWIAASAILLLALELLRSF